MAYVNLHVVDNCIEDKRFDGAVAKIAEYYADENYDAYEGAIEFYAVLFGLSENFIEDAAMDYYYFGPERG